MKRETGLKLTRLLAVVGAASALLTAAAAAFNAVAAALNAVHNFQL